MKAMKVMKKKAAMKAKSDEEEGCHEGHEGDEEEGSHEGHEGDEEMKATKAMKVVMAMQAASAMKALGEREVRLALLCSSPPLGCFRNSCRSFTLSVWIC